MFNADAKSGKPIRLKLKAGHTLTGTIQMSNNADLIPFLTTENGIRLKSVLAFRLNGFSLKWTPDKLRNFWSSFP